MNIKFLGIGGAMNTNSISTSFIIDNKVLFEAPPAIPNAIYKAKINIKKIDHVIISHLHGDHYFGLLFLILENFLIDRDTDLNIYGEENLLANTGKLLELAYPDMVYDEVLEKARVIFHPIMPGSIIHIGDEYKIKVVNAQHTDVVTCGFIIKNSSTTLYYSSDTSWFDEMDNFIQRADVSILDGSLEKFELPGHMSYSRIERIANCYPDKLFVVAHRSIYPCKEKVNLLIPSEGTSIQI